MARTHTLNAVEVDPGLHFGGSILVMSPLCLFLYALNLDEPTFAAMAFAFVSLAPTPFNVNSTVRMSSSLSDCDNHLAGIDLFLSFLIAFSISVSESSVSTATRTCFDSLATVFIIVLQEFHLAEKVAQQRLVWFD